MDDQEKTRNLSWIDLVISLIGIIILYLVLGFATSWVAAWWPHERVLLYVNGFLTQLLFFLIIWALIKLRNWSWGDLGWTPVNFRHVWGSVLRLYALTWLLNMTYGIYLYQNGLTPSDTDIYTKLLGNTTLFTFLLNALLAGIIAPIVEETLFRGIIFGTLQSYFGKWTAAAISSAIFSGLHFQAYGFFPRFVLGMVLAHLYEKNKSLYPSMALHSLNNMVAMTIVAGLGV